MSDPTAPGQPGVSRTNDEFLKIPKSGQELWRWGSVREACRILDDCDRGVIYDLLAVKAVRGYKPRLDSSNSHFKVDPLSVWEHKQRQLGE